MSASDNSTPTSLAAFASLVPNRSTALPPPTVAAGTANGFDTISAGPTNRIATATVSEPASGASAPTNANRCLSPPGSQLIIRGADGVGPSSSNGSDARVGPASSSFPSASLRQQQGSSIIGGYGASDLAPAGSVPFGQGGGMMAGRTNPIVRDAFLYNNAINNGGAGNYGVPMPPPGARYLPIGPGDVPPMAGGRGNGMYAFGEPDPDHLPPFDPTGRGIGRGGIMPGRGRGGLPRGGGGTGGGCDYYL